MLGAPPHQIEQLRQLATVAFAPPREESRGGLLGKLGPIFRRVPATPVMSPTQPEPRDVEVLLAGAYVPPERVGATWRVLETLVQGLAWGSTRLSLDAQQLDDLDFALARGGVSAAVGLRHLLSSTTSVNLIPVQGLTVGWHPHEKALAMAGAYRSALPQIKTDEQREMVNVAGDLVGRLRPLVDRRGRHRPAGARPGGLLGALTPRFSGRAPFRCW